MNINIRTTGKWILAGEHTVLRGGPALVFPFEGKQFCLSYTDSADEFSKWTKQKPQENFELKSVFEGKTGPDYQILFYGLVDRCLELLNIPRKNLNGFVKIDSDLPLGGGLGASAALCVAVVKWLHYLGYIEESKLYEMSRNLENNFHGESSGVDIAVALSGKPLYFKRDGTRLPFTPSWKPQLYLSYSGQKGLTQQCVEKVKNWMEIYPNKGLEIDTLMIQAVEHAKSALIDSSITHAECLEQLKSTIDEAEFCFKAWGLTEGSVQREIDSLKSHGALAAKPTGSGGGGYILSLWGAVPPEDLLKNKLIPCWSFE